MSYFCPIHGQIDQNKVYEIVNTDSSANTNLATETRYCSLCGRNFNTQNGLERHLNGLAHKQRIIQCPHCPMKFKTEKSLNQHIGAKH